MAKKQRPVEEAPTVSSSLLDAWICVLLSQNETAEQGDDITEANDDDLAEDSRTQSS